MPVAIPESPLSAKGEVCVTLRQQTHELEWLRIDHRFYCERVAQVAHHERCLWHSEVSRCRPLSPGRYCMVAAPCARRGDSPLPRRCHLRRGGVAREWISSAVAGLRSRK